MKQIEEIYLDEERFNPVINATVPGAWMVRYTNGDEHPICRDYEANNEEEARDILEKDEEAALADAGYRVMNPLDEQVGDHQTDFVEPRNEDGIYSPSGHTHDEYPRD